MSCLQTLGLWLCQSQLTLARSETLIPPPSNPLFVSPKWFRKRGNLGRERGVVGDSMNLGRVILQVHPGPPSSGCNASNPPLGPWCGLRRNLSRPSGDTKPPTVQSTKIQGTDFRFLCNKESALGRCLGTWTLNENLQETNLQSSFTIQHLHNAKEPWSKLSIYIYLSIYLSICLSIYVYTYISA